MKRMRMIAMFAMAGMLAVGSVAVAQKHERHGGKGDRREMMMRALGRLNLTDAQKAEIKQIREQFRQENAAALEEIKALHQQMKEAAKAKPRDAEQMKSLREQARARQEALRPARERMIEQIKGVLTPEQLAELEKMKEQRKGKRGKSGKKGEAGAERGGRGRGGSAID